ncbi:MAG: hypothetical protein F6K31_38420 [Symploca sp. SIO2G7]|nr:hypothetical protein [Symploca sp. SIO2G7]
MLSVCLLLVLTSCDRFGERTRAVINSITVENLSNGQKLLTNEDSDVQITVPEGWVNVRKSLRPGADLYVAHEDRSMYVLVLADQKRSEIGGFGLADNASQYLSYLDWGLEDEQPEQVTSLTSLNGLNAQQYEVRGEIDSSPVVYLHTTVEGENHYYQVVAWTTADNYAAAKGELQTVIGSFRGT